MPISLTSQLMYVMQASILVPMAVVWQRKRYFPAPLQRLSWYVYLSAFGVITARLGVVYLHNNHFFIVAFNLGKVVLFASVYAQVLAPTRLRQALLLASALAVGLGFGVLLHDYLTQTWGLGLATSRVAQGAVLAAFALVYLDQELHLQPNGPASHNPIWLLSIGQLLYSAGTVSAFSIEILIDKSPIGAMASNISYYFVAGAGLVFNYFLTLAFWRAGRYLVPTPERRARQAVKS